MLHLARRYYIRGKDNVVVDALSRKDEEVKTYTISVTVLDSLDEIGGEYAKDPDTCALINDHNQGPKLKWRNDILWYKGRIYLSPTSRFKTKVLKKYHDSPAAGNVVFFKTYYNAKESFHWKGMYKDIQKYVAECDTCQRNKSKNVTTPMLLHLLHMPTQQLEEDKTVVVVDCLTKYAHFMGIKKTDFVKQIVEILCKYIYKLHGFS